ncbi:hypothetical protein [Streptomyces zhihengii]|uniref:hypothetical protein n=1 Tax=Streptomyces zhihengii TaxID=1818004 RepID=UPI00339DF64D
MPSYQAVLAETDWAALQTAFGSGADLPGVLARLLEPDPTVQVTALSELSELVNHQSTIYEATAPAVMFVAGILTHPATMTLRPYRDIRLRATLLGWLAAPLQDASDEAVGCIEQRFPGFLAPGTTMAAFRNLRPMLYRAVAPFLRDRDEDVREAAVVTALILAEHPALAEYRDHLAVHARRVLDTSSDDRSRRVAGKALEVWGHAPSGPGALREEPYEWQLRSDGRGDIDPPF